MSDHIYLCLTELLDQDTSSMEYFNSLPDDIRHKLLQDDDVRCFSQLQKRSNELRNKNF